MLIIILYRDCSGVITAISNGNQIHYGEIKLVHVEHRQHTASALKCWLCEAIYCQSALAGLVPGLECVLTSDLDQSRAVAHPWTFVS